MARILVVEDDDEIRELLAEALKRWGHDPVLTANGQQGLDRYQAESFDLMVSDIRMPVMDGLTLLKTIRETDQRMPVVIVTAYPTVDSAVESLGVGADHYLVKPINLDDLKAKVDKCLEKTPHAERDRQVAAPHPLAVGALAHGGGFRLPCGHLVLGRYG